MPKVKKNSLDELTEEKVALLGIDYVAKKDLEKRLKAELTDVRKPLESWMDANQSEIDGGSKLCILSHAGTNVNLKRTLRSSLELVPEAEDILKAEGLNDCLEEITLIREDRIEAMFKAGKITDEQLKKIYRSKDSFAFSVKLTKKSDIPEI